MLLCKKNSKSSKKKHGTLVHGSHSPYPNPPPHTPCPPPPPETPQNGLLAASCAQKNNKKCKKKHLKLKKKLFLDQPVNLSTALVTGV